MVIKNLFSKVWLKGQYEVFKYAARLCRKSDDDIRAIVDHDFWKRPKVEVSGHGSHRGAITLLR